MLTIGDLMACRWRLVDHAFCVCGDVSCYSTYYICSKSFHSDCLLGKNFLLGETLG